MFVKPGRETIASHTNSTPKDKNETHGKGASQKDAGRQTPRHGPQLREAPGPKRKNMPPAQMTMTREPHIAKAPPAAQVRQQGKEHATETRTTHPHPKDKDRNTIPRRPRQEDAQNPAHTTRTERPTCPLPLRPQHCSSPHPGSHIFPSPSTPTGKEAHPLDRDNATPPKEREQGHHPAPRRPIPVRH